MGVGVNRTDARIGIIRHLDIGNHRSIEQSSSCGKASGYGEGRGDVLSSFHTIFYRVLR